MRTINYLIGLFIVGTCFAVACTDEESISVSATGSEIQLRCSIDQLYESRVNDSGFTDGDGIGVYVVDYIGDKPGTLKNTGNNADNILFKFSEKENKWNGERPIYWKDRFTSVEAYSYYPYILSIQNVEKIPFEVHEDQSAIVDTHRTGYEMSDFLWAKDDEAAAEDKQLVMVHKHLLSQVKINLLRGSSISVDEWDKLKKTVIIENTIRQTEIDLRNGDVKLATGQSVSKITPYIKNDVFYAIVAPQNVDADITLLSLSIGDKIYDYKRNEQTTYYAGKSHTFTLQVEKEVQSGDFSLNIISQSVTPWVTDEISHNGVAKEYIVIHTPKAGKLQEEIEKKIENPSQIKNLKVIGEMGYEDFIYIKEHVTSLEAINLRNVKLKQCPYKYANYEEVKDDAIPAEAFQKMYMLQYVVFPKEMTCIGDFAFQATLLTGSLEIPEGVDYIGRGAFTGKKVYHTDEIYTSNLTGTLTLPSTLRYIGDNAFAELPLTGNLSIPENVEEIGESAFENCVNLSGGLHFPPSVKVIGEKAFSGMKGMYGDLILPENLSRLESQSFTGNFNTITLPKYLKIIERRAFEFSLKGDVVFPPTLHTLEEYAFEGANINHIQFNDKIKEIGRGAFYRCQLDDTLYLPKTITRISEEAFAENLYLKSIVVPQNIEFIEKKAFAFCRSVQTVICEGLVPPVIEDETSFDFVSVAKTTLIVPAEALERYKNAPFWRDFPYITTHRDFAVHPHHLSVLNQITQRNLEVLAKGAWKVTHCPTWCHLSATEGFKKAHLDLTIDEHHKSGNRLDSIVITFDAEKNLKTSVRIFQWDAEYADGECVTLQKAKRGKGINIIFVGDGYDARNIANGDYLADMRKEMEHFFGVEPYTTYRNYFNVYTLVALSNESGVSTRIFKRDCKFDTTYGRSDGKRIYVDHMAVMNYVANLCPSVKLNETLIIVVPNSTVYEGVTFMWGDGSAIAVCPKSNKAFPYDARGVIQHEAGGHGFGKLADEYIYHDKYIQLCKCICCNHVEELLEGKRMGFYKNVSLNGSYETNEWRQLIFDPVYSDEVDLYEGAYFHGRGVYRPEWNSCMNNNVPYFNAPSRLEIVKRIKQLAGETFSYQEFVETDKKTKNNSSRSGYGVIEQRETPYVHHAPVILEGSPNIKK